MALYPNIQSSPYSWPFHGSFDMRRTALLCCVDAHCSMTARAAERIESLVSFFLKNQAMVVIARNGEPTWLPVRDFTERLVVSAPGLNAFIGTSLDLALRGNGIEDLMFVGGCTEYGVHATMRDANDRGFECLLVQDACVGHTPDGHQAIIDITMTCHGLFGTVAGTDDVLRSCDAELARLGEKQ